MAMMECPNCGEHLEFDFDDICSCDECSSEECDCEECGNKIKSPAKARGF